jgi:hypothetical protein
MKGSLRASFHCAQAAKQLVTPMAVAMAVSTLIAIWMMSFHVSFFIVQSSFFLWVNTCVCVPVKR